MSARHPGVRDAIAAAVLFGAATPFASRLAGDASPQVLAGLLYVGSGAVLGATMLAKPSRREAPLTRRDMPLLVGAIVFGGGVAPLLLLIGLRTTPAATASLLLNLEVVFTAALAWFAFHEGVDRRVGLGFGLILVGAMTMSWTGEGTLGVTPGALAVVGACAAWAIDNNLTQKVSAKEPRQIAMIKGLAAGSVNLLVGLVVGGSLPRPGAAAAAMALGAVGYGMSLMLFVRALRALGSARTGAYFAVAPFVGVLLAIAVFREPVTARVWPAGALMAAGVLVHLSERHVHRHTHEPLLHSHGHTHDDVHHRHAHAQGIDVAPDHIHEHEHQHAAMVHQHSHRPDIHHRHRHHRSSRV